MARFLFQRTCLISLAEDDCTCRKQQRRAKHADRQEQDNRQDHAFARRQAEDTPLGHFVRADFAHAKISLELIFTYASAQIIYIRHRVAPFTARRHLLLLSQILVLAAETASIP